ncbi:unnamed protein product [Menidia menidia]|uniref:(Atlantic silverside) hypothetical protein n=1 Tax=Menidia menidia TaxID=238744 RepID=A0A8S4BLY4_9TELE|nr:unnamed protein product [Menidia menidia]
MEEAYSELYQQFLHLRSLCLRQAALLHQLTTALQKQQGAAVPNGDLSAMVSIPVQCSHEIPLCLLEKPQPLTAGAPCGVDYPFGNVGTVAGLAEDMLKLSVDLPYQRKQGVIGTSKSPGQNHPAEDSAPHTATMPASDCSFLAAGLPNQSDEALMSDVVLQSHVCEFCQAVFPRDAATRGEFLRHLYTHVT